MTKNFHGNGTGTNYQRQQTLVPKKKVVSLRRLDRKNEILSPMLYDLYSTVSLHPHYKGIKRMIGEWLPKKQEMFEDGVGNIIIKVGEKRETMFSCHIDMVFSKRHFDGEEPPKKLDIFASIDQKGDKSRMVWGGVVTEIKPEGGCVYQPTQLGADDNSGVYILLKLIKQGTPGLYIFHVGEECGGIGSMDIVRRSPKLVKGIKRAIAFDRMGYFDIINNQRGGICCSPGFVKSLATQLNDLIVTPHQFKDQFSSAVGSFTDTANYIHLIPECTNISVGYFNQHSENEHQDCWWLEEILMPAALKIDYDALTTDRVPVKKNLWAGHDEYDGRWSDGIYTAYGANAPVQTKYVPFNRITYNTPREKLPPWQLSRGIIKSASDPGMRRLLEKWQEEVNVYVQRSDILIMLRRMTTLEIENEAYKNLKADKEPEKKVISGGEAGVATQPWDYHVGMYRKEMGRQISDKGEQELDDEQKKLPAPVSEQEFGNTPEKIVKLMAKLNQLLTGTFKVFTSHTNEYSWAAATNADILEWAYKDITKFEKHTIKEFTDMLMEMTVIHTTLIETTYKRDCDLDAKLLSTVTRNLAFLQKEWFFLGFDNYAAIQVSFAQFKSEIEEEEAREATKI